LAERILADVLFKTDPYLVKHWRKVWMSGGAYRGLPLPPFVVDHEPEFMPLAEQQERFAQAITEQGLFEFLLRPALREGEVSNAVIPISIANLDRDGETGAYQFPNAERVARLRRALESQAGIPAAAILKELDASLPGQRGQRDGHARPLREQPQPQQQRTSDIAVASPHQPAQRHHQSRRRIS
jgi:hypothetical protein